jgi:DNA anti-recombination protein RmuC
MPNEKETQVAALEKTAQTPMGGAARRAETGDRASADPDPRSGADRVLGGLERVREILLGDVLVELERRIARIDGQLGNRASEVQLDVRHRTGVLEAYVRKEIDALSARAGQAGREVNDSIRSLRDELREAIARLEQRLAGIEDRLDASIARLEREARQQLLDQSKSFLDELERVRDQLRSALVRELGLEPAGLDEGGEHDAGAWTTPH